MFEYPKVYDVIVIGAGHAGAEAALAASRMGCETLLLTMNLDTIGQMSCNPAIGGLAKGQIVREIDAMGGEMGLNTDATGIQFRMLNASKGPSVRGPRAQCDKKAYQFRLKATCERQERLDVKQGHIAEILERDGRVTGVTTQLGVYFRARAVVVTTGTFLQGLMHVGLRYTPGGRMGDSASGLSASLLKLGFELKRLKTGTPPRLLKKSIDFSQMELQQGDEPPKPFSYLADSLRRGRDDLFTLNEWRDGMFHVEQLPCAITYTTAQTHEIVRSNLDKSPLYCGRIEGVGPRYCPSLEDKVVRFADKDRHQLFLEPEGRHTDEYYVNGCSTSLPFEVQLAFIRSVPGLEKAEIMRAGYAVEYDFSPPTQLQPSLETKRVEGLFFAGQLNGTSGYEEAAGQGLIAGINAARKLQGKPPLVLRRDQAYLGVLIDDLVTKGTEEPYRMFTSRAEHRLSLRHDNADLRLTAIGAEVGLASSERAAKFRAKEAALAETRALLQTLKREGVAYAHLLKRPDVSWSDLPSPFNGVDAEVASQLETEIKYEGYLKREQAHIERNRGDEERTIPDWIDFDAIPGLKAEARTKLKKIQPRTFAQAARISGINPTDVALLQVHTKRGKSAALARG
ncbi:MAG TPA: tRNA uridine-5-carboxymethylaminomethyl(34) synthesis enzyme MnmG [Candidatus Methylacidiphilales bacterium]|nr:tRNA uridine-5-carboxymethylaminomethyl(34) synthesis enzyme MnmG [Candidatus Methylacidiphilales bacterium]